MDQLVPAAITQQRFLRGLTYGLAYTYSHALGVTSFNPVVPNNETWNYGRLSIDKRHNFQANYSYEIPNLGKRLNSKILGAVVDHWTLSGIISAQEGPVFSPSFSITSGTPDYTGTPDVGARVNVVGDPFANVPADERHAILAGNAVKIFGFGD